MGEGERDQPDKQSADGGANPDGSAAALGEPVATDQRCLEQDGDGGADQAQKRKGGDFEIGRNGDGVRIDDEGGRLAEPEA